MQAFLSMHVDWRMCGSCGWLSPVSLPLKTLAKRNVFFTGFGCHMSGIMDRTAGRNMRRCVQPAAIDMQLSRRIYSCMPAHFVDCCHPNAGVRCRYFILKSEIPPDTQTHRVTHRVSINPRNVLSRQIPTDEQALCLQYQEVPHFADVFGELSCTSSANREQPRGAPVCECVSGRASDTGMCHSSCKPLSS